MHRVAYPQLRCVGPKRCQSLLCNGPFGATYDSTDTRKQQSSLRIRTFNNSLPLGTDTMKRGWEGGPWRGPGRNGRNADACLSRHESRMGHLLTNNAASPLLPPPPTIPSYVGWGFKLSSGCNVDVMNN